METFIYTLIFGFISAITIFAYHHPKGYSDLVPYFIIVPTVALFSLSRATSEQQVGHHTWEKGQAGPTRRVNARMADDNVRKLTPQSGLW